LPANFIACLFFQSSFLGYEFAFGGAPAWNWLMAASLIVKAAGVVGLSRLPALFY
jgi:hypothetical protein